MATDFGSGLRQARERRGLTLRQIASVTKINVSALEALEANDPSKLPGGIFSRAFVRAYAQEVGLDADATVRQFLETFAQDVEPLKAVIVPRLLAPAIAVVVLVAAAAIGFRFIGWPGGTATSEPSTAPSAAASAPLPVAPAAPVPAPPVLQPETPSETSAAVTDVAANDAGATPPSGDAASAPTATALAPPAVPVRDDGLMRISFRPQGGPCWVQVVADGKVELSRMLGAGEIETRAARDAFDVKVGDAGRCAYTLNDRPGRPLGPAGKVVRVRIDRQSLATFFQGS